MKEAMTQAELEKKLAALGPIDEATRNRIVCSMIGHSRIQTYFFGYYYCARCGEQIGDHLGSVYAGAEKAVIVGHNCNQCRLNYEACTWKDKLFTPDPFAPESEEAEQHPVSAL